MNEHTSFRDPAGQLLISNNRVFRAIFESGGKDIEAFLASRAAKQFINDGCIVDAQIPDPMQVTSILPESFTSSAEIILEHDNIFFPSYPIEWPPEMLNSAAKLTLNLAERFVDEGMGLKDATPYNILFRGPRPIFVDVLSIELRDSNNPIWLPKAQFERTFLFPLLAQRHFGITLDQIFLGSREGIKPERMYAYCSLIERVMPPFFWNVTLPVWLSKQRKDFGEDIYEKRLTNDPEKARFILKYTLRRLRRLLNIAATSAVSQTSDWSNYDTDNSYSDKNYVTKAEFIENSMHQYAPRTVLDIGCNTGRFSKIAAINGAKVVAIDIDPVVVGRLWNVAYKKHLDIQPLVVNLAQPTPATGWCNKETLSFLARASGKFEAVFMLAVIHHLLITERIPLREILLVAACLTTKLLIIEFVGRDDQMFRHLCRGRMELYQWYTKEAFELAAAEFFETIKSARLGETQRWLYILRKK